MSDEQHDPDTAMQRFENLLGRIVSAGKKDVKNAEEAVERVVDDAIGAPPAHGRALADEED